MANSPKSDADCIESAYEDTIGALYKQLFENSAGDPGNNQKYVASFMTEYKVAQHAKQLAFGVVGTKASAATRISKGRKRASG